MPVFAVSTAKGPNWDHARGNREQRFWDEHVSAVSRFDFQVKDSFANGPCCANIVTITMTIGTAATMTVDCVVVYTVNDTGQITSLRGYWEPDRATATLTAL